MRRTFAISLIFIFCLPVGMMLAKGLEEDPLPACCRRDGKHHCAMTAMLMGMEGKSFRSESICPLQRAGQMASSVAFAAPAPASDSTILACEKLLSTDSLLAERASSLTQRQRGPPSLDS